MDFLDFNSPQWEQLLGVGGTLKPPTPPPPPPQVMANAPPSFAPNSSFDGGGLQPPNFNQRFSPGPEPSMPPQAIPYAPAPPTGAGFPNEPPPAAASPGPQPPPMAPGPDIRASNLQSQVAWPGVRGAQAPQGGPIINRTSRYGPQSEDDDGAPPSSVLPGGLAASLGAPSPLQRDRTISNALMGLGKGLSAVGQLKPGTTGGASFAAGAGGAFEGSGQHEEKGLDRDIKEKEHEAALALRGATLDENKRYHQDRIDVERDKMTARLNGGPGGRDFQFDHKYNAWLAVHKDDHEGALDYANGHKKMDTADQNKAAVTLAHQTFRDQLRDEARTDFNGEKTVSNLNPEQRKKYIDGLVEDNRKRLKGEPAYKPPAAPVPAPVRPGQRGADPDRMSLPPSGPVSAPSGPGPGKITPFSVPQSPVPPQVPTVPPQVPPPAPGVPPAAPATAGAPMPSRPVVPGTAAPPAPAPTAPPTGATAAPKRAAPPLPDKVPPGSGWSPTLQVWRSPDGKFFDKDGKPVAGPSQ